MLFVILEDDIAIHFPEAILSSVKHLRRNFCEIPKALHLRCWAGS